MPFVWDCGRGEGRLVDVGAGDWDDCSGRGDPVELFWLAASADLAFSEAAASDCLPFLPGAAPLGEASPFASLVWRATERA